ncbi:MAG: HDIG domain-containing protein [Candidatus Marinimicrobia bacterium]|nr:HDIG domain-containing protein [Candidatus Neomarinimicrobiota bacterium]
MTQKTREDAWKLLNEFTKDPSLIKHALAVEAAMRAYAKFYNENEELWATTGLIHDFDYERFPSMEEHPYKGNEILKEQGWPEEITTAVMGHADYTNIPRESLLSKVLFAVDELAGFVMAVALVRPSKSIHEVAPKSVKKKLKTPAFSRAVSREDISKGIEELGVDETEHIQRVIDGLKTVAKELDLEGNPD